MQAGTPGPLEEFTPFVRCSIIDPMAEDDKKAIIFNALAVDVFKQLGELIDCVHDEYPYELYVAPVNDVVEQFRRSSRVVYDWIIQHYGSCEDFLESQLDKVFTGRGPRMRMNALRYTVITHQEYSSDRRLPKLTKTLSRQDLLLVLYQKDYFYWITNKFNKNRIKRTPVVRSNGSTSATNSTHNTAGATTGQNAVQPMYDRLTTEIMNFYTVARRLYVYWQRHGKLTVS
ncbi:uncharacterized protein BYT42DRAFT_275068 [Radiomyces spectabilis]|uniref:uncharacterized protein n=1 Tax=Radiomyces spectabilis TaxID=64574 RepID=UPI00221F0F3C|nr:uncharacterized protein BYT42DRAFT_275068 [Radiomyces spectabilis]KAI8384807.1 hypothetical protein BYT42DRAFT_275068 [Radiomyces spectabilis]